MKPPRLAWTLALAALLAGCEGKTTTEVRVMTWNLNVGIDLDAIFAQTTPQGIYQQVEIAWQQRGRTSFAKRATAVADAIHATQPDVVGLQEVARYYMGPAGGHATDLVEDFLAELLDALAARGEHYALGTVGGAASEVTNAHVELPGMDAAGNYTSTYAIADDEAVIVRSGIQVTGVRTGNYAAHIEVPIAGTTFPYQRGWVAVDVVKSGKAFTVFSTHLDAYDPRVQGAQAYEVRRLVNVAAPTLVVGDMNSDPTDAAWPSYGILVSSTTGLADAVAEAGPAVPTCCHDALMSDPAATLARRIDHVLHTAHFQSFLAEREGGPGSFSASYGLWPSDHAGQFVSVGLE